METVHTQVGTFGPCRMGEYRQILPILARRPSPGSPGRPDQTVARQPGVAARKHYACEVAY